MGAVLVVAAAAAAAGTAVVAGGTGVGAVAVMNDDEGQQFAEFRGRGGGRAQKSVRDRLPVCRPESLVKQSATAFNAAVHTHVSCHTAVVHSCCCVFLVYAHQYVREGTQFLYVVRLHSCILCEAYDTGLFFTTRLVLKKLSRRNKPSLPVGVAAPTRK